MRHRGPVGDGRTHRSTPPRPIRCNTGSAFTSATSSSTAKTFLATASTSRPASRALPSRAAWRSPTPSTSMCAGGSRSPSSIAASMRSRTSPGRCTSGAGARAMARSPTALADAEPALPEKPSIAVLPFNNMSGDPEQGYFADGITEDIITDLSKVSGLFVIARNSSFAYKGQAPDIRKVSRELGVRYVLEGSVRRAASRVRINAQMIDGADGRPSLGGALRPRPRGHFRGAGRGDPHHRHGAQGAAHHRRADGARAAQEDQSGGLRSSRPRPRDDAAAPSRSAPWRRAEFSSA